VLQWLLSIELYEEFAFKVQRNILQKKKTQANIGEMISLPVGM